MDIVKSVLKSSGDGAALQKRVYVDSRSCTLERVGIQHDVRVGGVTRNGGDAVWCLDQVHVEECWRHVGSCDQGHDWWMCIYQCW